MTYQLNRKDAAIMYMTIPSITGHGRKTTFEQEVANLDKAMRVIKKKVTLFSLRDYVGLPLLYLAFKRTNTYLIKHLRDLPLGRLQELQEKINELNGHSIEMMQFSEKHPLPWIRAYLYGKLHQETQRVKAEVDARINRINLAFTYNYHIVDIVEDPTFHG